MARFTGHSFFTDTIFLMSNYCEITIQIASEEQSDILVAELSELGYEGFEEMDGQLKAFIKEADFDETILNKLLSNDSITYTLSIINKQNWNAVWEANFEPVQVDDFVGVRASFHPTFQNLEYEIVITPKMSFGTGHHATTYMVMQLMRELDFTGKTVFDFGTGTGILAILAEKLGAQSILAVDNDDWCIENATENIQINRCEHITIDKIDILKFDSKFDIIIANINKNVILQNIAILKQGLEKGGQIVLSGLLAEDETDIHNACQLIGFQHKKTISRNGWIAIWYF